MLISVALALERVYNCNPLPQNTGSVRHPDYTSISSYRSEILTPPVTLKAAWYEKEPWPYSQTKTEALEPQPTTYWQSQTLQLSDFRTFLNCCKNHGTFKSSAIWSWVSKTRTSYHEVVDTKKKRKKEKKWVLGWERLNLRL